MGNGIIVGDIGTDHDGFPATPVTAGSGTVKFDGVAAARAGDPLEPHDKPKNPCHDRAIAAGSGSVKIDGMPAARAGDPVTCGGVLTGGSSVNIG
ncbi:type VI secretion system PAAR protein [Vibrio sp. SCSIO 43135]|uniref:Type VI secretion system PAAR protein n=1 Tax=Vibrio paucivorans TaxID=2829489 RepID=A0A9X3CJQ4_9VIBR|nr:MULTISPECIES: type VI secretion system PAAR protein [Vibrio]MCW8336080.1 type VI secretion system PAAR protein [Vibrio paucivorans]USD43069.1 type VI secretion system PAAR protein [Vibrio sp. SCSIO 43135]